MSISREKKRVGTCSAVVDLSLSESEEGATPEALLYALPYLGAMELLVLERVNRQLRDAIQGDALVWQQLHVEIPLNRRVTDVELVRLASRAQGRLQSLSLFHCSRVTQEAVESVVASNPLLQKLSLPGCTKVSIEAITGMVKQLTEARSPELPAFCRLRIRGIYGITSEIFETLNRMIAKKDSGQRRSSRSQQFYKNGEPASAIDEKRTIDVEACPKCEAVRMVYDCTRPTCKSGSELPRQQQQQCRGCTLCITRCEECGTCVDDDDDDAKTLFTDFVCQSCWFHLPKCSFCNGAVYRIHVLELDKYHDVCFTCCDPLTIYIKPPDPLTGRRE